MTTPPAGLDRHPLSTEEITATLADVYGTGGQLPAPFPTDTHTWMITDLTDGRLTGRRPATGSTWARSDQAFPDSCPTPPDADEPWRLQQLRLFTGSCEIIITGGDPPHGWIHIATPTDSGAALAPRYRAFLLGPRHGRVTHCDGFSRVEDTATGTLLILPLPWQPPTATAHGTTGTWLHTCEHFTDDPDTGAVGVTHTRYTALTTDRAVDPQEAQT